MPNQLLQGLFQVAPWDSLSASNFFTLHWRHPGVIADVQYRFDGEQSFFWQP
tara:strand:- start:459 stop:614 length:156 start_codon:yes stop_codon:yes gene_type:complete